ncbi:hypothetical protein [Streptomyces sp. NPDC053367]|uniref:hypothetical protein n=1 Tax=Streptomyces sp. NPDC053367 TaxID=3365700 RepID=UPI0037D02D74
MSQGRTGPAHLPQPLRAVASGVRRLPGAGQVGKVADGALDRIGAVSPRGRRMAVYAGAGVLGVAGAIEWPVALTGAAVAWLTQPRPRESGQQEQRQPDRAGTEPAGDAEDPEEPYGAGDKLAPSHFHRDPLPDTTARVGDPATASALKKVAEATAHHDPEATAHHDPEATAHHDPEAATHHDPGAATHHDPGAPET